MSSVVKADKKSASTFWSWVKTAGLVGAVGGAWYYREKIVEAYDTAKLMFQTYRSFQAQKEVQELAEIESLRQSFKETCSTADETVGKLLGSTRSGILEQFDHRIDKIQRQLRSAVQQQATSPESSDSVHEELLNDLLVLMTSRVLVSLYVLSFNLVMHRIIFVYIGRQSREVSKLQSSISDSDISVSSRALQDLVAVVRSEHRELLPVARSCSSRSRLEAVARAVESIVRDKCKSFDYLPTSLIPKRDSLQQFFTECLSDTHELLKPFDWILNRESVFFSAEDAPFASRDSSGIGSSTSALRTAYSELATNVVRDVVESVAFDGVVLDMVSTGCRSLVSSIIDSSDGKEGLRVINLLPKLKGETEKVLSVLGQYYVGGLKSGQLESLSLQLFLAEDIKPSLGDLVATHVVQLRDGNHVDDSDSSTRSGDQNLLPNSGGVQSRPALQQLEPSLKSDADPSQQLTRLIEQFVSMNNDHKSEQ